MKTAAEILNEHTPYGHKWSSFLLPDQLQFMVAAMKEYAREACREQRDICANNGKVHWHTRDFSSGSIAPIIRRGSAILELSKESIFNSPEPELK